MWFKVEPSGLEFIDQAKHFFENELILDATPDEVFEVFADCDSWPKWFDDFVSAEWETEPPHGVGSERKARLKTMAARERFIAWEPGKRYSFTILALSVPLVSRMVEDYRLEPVDGGKTRLLWNVYYQPRLFIRPFNVVIRPIFKRMFKRAMKGLESYVAAL